MRQDETRGRYRDETRERDEMRREVERTWRPDELGRERERLDETRDEKEVRDR